jgi:hypothetical protein
MDMWVSHAMRKRSCVVCTKQIEPGDRVMVGQFKRKYPWGTRTRRSTSHLECWYTNAHVWLDDHPYTPTVKAGPGRPVSYTPEQAANRKALRVNISRWKTKQQEYIGQGLWAMAGRYEDKVTSAREVLSSM